MENEKAAYFAQYWKQPVQRYNNDHYIKEVNGFIDDTLLKGDYLLLTPLSAITDEDAIEVAKMYHPGNDRCTILRKQDFIFTIDVDSSSSVEFSLEIELDFSRTFQHSYLSKIHGRTYGGEFPDRSFLCISDFLRSKGYALPWRQYSVEQLIEMGWLQLTNNRRKEE